MVVTQNHQNQKNAEHPRRGGGHFDFGGSERHPSVERAKRKLFGPVDHAEAKLFAEKELEALQEKAAQKWNFDFKTGKPRPSADDTGYKWVKFSPNEQIPKAYDLQGCEYLHLHADISARDDGERSSPASSSGTIKQCNKQSVITDFMKPTKRTNLNTTKSSSMSSVSQDEPAPKKARARSS